MGSRLSMEPPEAPGESRPARTEPNGFGALSRPARFAVALAGAVLVLATVWQMTTAFFFVAPSNTVSQEWGDTMDDYALPEFYRAWRLFAPNPVRVDVHVQMRVETRGEGTGLERRSEWIDLSEQDYDRMRHALLPSYTNHQLRRAWGNYDDTHDDETAARGQDGVDAARYLHRLTLPRVAEELGIELGDIERLQVRTATFRPPPPPWTGQPAATEPDYEQLDWHTVTPADLPGGAGEGEQP